MDHLSTISAQVNALCDDRFEVVEKMELHAAGFNAWGQLRFDNSTAGGNADEPADFGSFTLVLRDEAIHAVQPLLSYTSGKPFA
jgi:hypothetical protein